MDNGIKDVLDNTSKNGAIKSIVDNLLVIDEQARSLTRQAMAERARKTEELEAKKRQLMEQYMAEADQKIELFRTALEAKSQRRLEASLQNEKDALDVMNALAAEKSEQWVQQMYDAIIK